MSRFFACFVTDFYFIHMNLLWLDLNSSYAHSSLALPALHAQIKDNNIKWVKVSATINENPGMIAGEIYQYRPDIIAATCWLFNHEELMHILSRTKSLMPECQIILGGPEFLGDNKRFLIKNDFVDCVFRGEGENIFGQWLEQWDDKTKWTVIEGLCYFDNEGTYHDNGISRVTDFESIISPEESCFFNWEKPFVQLETTRGCFNTCAFCVSGGEKPVRNLSIEKIRERIRTIHDHGIRNIRVLDRTFNYNTRHAISLLELFKEYPDTNFHLEIHPALLSETIKKELSSMPKGLLHLEAGIQSLKEQVLTSSKRVGKLQDALEGLKFLCSLENMETHADLIAGLPHYRLEEIFEDIRTLAGFNAGEIQLELLKLLPGTEMRRRAEELGIRYSPLPPYEVLETDDISSYELQTARLLSRLLDGFYNAKTWQKVTRKLIIKDEEFLHTFLKYLTDIGVINQPLGLERRGIILYDFCKTYYNEFLIEVTQAWIEAGMSLKKKPAENIKTKHVTPPDSWKVIFGEYKEEFKLCYIPSEDKGSLIWYAFNTYEQAPKPVFKALSKPLKHD